MFLHVYGRENRVFLQQTKLVYIMQNFKTFIYTIMRQLRLQSYDNHLSYICPFLILCSYMFDMRSSETKDAISYPLVIYLFRYRPSLQQSIHPNLLIDVPTHSLHPFIKLHHGSSFIGSIIILDRSLTGVKGQHQLQV